MKSTSQTDPSKQQHTTTSPWGLASQQFTGPQESLLAWGWPVSNRKAFYQYFDIGPILFKSFVTFHWSVRANTNFVIDIKDFVMLGVKP